jgi:hypothetical protein
VKSSGLRSSVAEMADWGFGQSSTGFIAKP